MRKVSKTKLAAVLGLKPSQYKADFFAAVVAEDLSHYYLQPSEFLALRTKYKTEVIAIGPQGSNLKNHQKLSKVKPKVIRFIESRKAETDVGVGDTLDRLIVSVGGRKFKKLMKWLGQPCGCDDRRRWLNAKYPY